MPRKPKLKCVLPGCTSDAKYKRAQLCERCYQFMYYWQRRSVSDRMAHVNKIGFWNERVAALIPEQVARMPQKKKRRA